MVDLSNNMAKASNEDKVNKSLLIKFISEEYVYDLTNKGRFRFSSIGVSQHPGKKEVGAPLEGADLYINPKNNFTITWGLSLNQKPILDLIGQGNAIIVNKCTDFTHILSFYQIGIHQKFGVNNIKNQKFINARCLEYGDKCIIIWNVAEFRSRMLHQLEKQQADSKCNSKKAFFIDIGNIEDITHVYDTKTLLNNHSLDASIEQGITRIQLPDHTFTFANLTRIKD